MNSIQADQIYTTQKLQLDGEEGARLNSKRGMAEVVGQDVKIVSQDGGDATGRVTVDAIDQARINSGKKVKLTAPVVDLNAQAVIMPRTHEDPELAGLVAGTIWFHTGLKVWRGYDGVSIKTLKFV